MTRAKVFGEDVRITLKSNDEQIPLILDFDSCEITSLRQNKVYKAIGKRVSKPHSSTTGYKIVLTRAKRDNYIEALSQYIDYFLERGLEYPTFSVERIVNFQYDIEEIDPSEEFIGDIVKQKKQFSNVLVKNALKQQEAFQNKAFSAFSTALNFIDPNINKTINNAQNGFNNTIDKFKNGLDDLNKLNPFSSDSLEDSDVYKAWVREVRDQQESFKFLKSIYCYKNCTISEESFADRPREITDERIVLYSSNRVNKTTENDYDDKYLKKYFNELATDKVYNQLDKIKNSDNTQDLEMMNLISKLYDFNLEE